MNPERAFLRTLTPPPRSDDSSSVDSADIWPPEVNTTGCVYDPRDDIWRCVHCGWEVETFDGIGGFCFGGHEVDLTRVDGWHSTSVWDNGMWSAESGEESEEEGAARRVRRSCSGGEWLILPTEGSEEDGGTEVDEEGSEDGDGLEEFIVDDDEEEVGDSGMGDSGMEGEKDGMEGVFVDGDRGRSG